MVKQNLKKKMNCCVPQGTCLGTLLFSIYINSLTNIEISGNLELFADDTALIVDGDSTEELYGKSNKDLLKNRNWLIENKLSLNICKTQCIDFSTKVKKNNKLIIHSYCCKDSKNCSCSSIEIVDSYKYLGCVLNTLY